MALPSSPEIDRKFRELVQNSKETKLEQKLNDFLGRHKVNITGDEVSLALRNPSCTPGIIRTLVRNGSEVTYDDLSYAFARKGAFFKTLLEASSHRVRACLAERQPDVVLQFMSKSGDARLSIYKILVEQCPVDINYCVDSRTALQEAVVRGFDDVFAYLLTRPDIDVNSASAADQRPPLQIAIEKADYYKAEQLLLHFANVKDLDLSRSFRNHNGFSLTFALLATLGQPVDTRLIIAAHPNLTEKVQLELSYFDDWCIEQRRQLKTLKELAAVSVRRSLTSRCDLNKVLDLLEWDAKVKDCLQLKHVR